MFRVRLPLGALALLLAATALIRAAPADAGLLLDGLHVAPVDAPPTDRILVKWREAGVAAVRIDNLPARTARLVNATGLPLRGVRALGSRMDVLRLADSGLFVSQRAALESAVARLRADPSVEYAEPDERIYILGVPNDPRYAPGADAQGSWRGQWYLGAPNTTTPAAIGAVTAWDSSVGANINVAVIDTGFRLDHPDMAGQFLAGRDFVCNDNGVSCTSTAAGTTFLTANDGDGWDADPSDPGDYISAADLARPDGFFKGCGSGTNHDQPNDSSWHGTRVSGLIAAVTNNAIGMASVAPAAKIVPVRAIGKCTGYSSDLIAALYWAAGISDNSLGTLSPATSANTAQVINLSLGNRLDCSTAEQAAISAVLARGIVVVAAAGNDGGPIGAPANCTGVLAVAGLRHIGTKVGYSNVSSTAASISIAAPAGNCVNTAAGAPCLYSLETLSNTGHQGPDPSDATNSYTYAALSPGYTGNSLNGLSVGTSFAAPLVSGVAALMKSLNSGLTPAQIIARMQQSAATFPVPDTPATGGICHVAALTRDSSGVYTDVQNLDCQCTTATCGAGMLNATAAVAAAIRPTAVIVSSATVASIGQRITLDGSGSSAATSHQITSYAWTSDQGVSIGNANGAIATVIFPALRPINITLTVTDEGGRRDSMTTTIDSTLTSSSSSSGGGGALDLLGLTALLALLLAGTVRPAANPVTRRFGNRN